VGKVSDGNEVNWERKVLEKLALEALAEQKRGRRWGIFFKLLGFGYLALLLVVALDLGKGDHVAEGAKFTALVDLQGVIKAKGDANAEHVISALQAAFEDKHTAGVILRINSPGRQSGAVGHHQRRDASPARKVPGDSAACGGRGRLRFGRLLRGRRRRQDLRGQGQHRRLDRRADGWLRLHRHHGQARRRAPPADRRRKQGLSRSLLAAERDTTRTMPSRCWARSTSSSSTWCARGAASASRKRRRCFPA
jgi:hypothetical protein